MIHLESEDQSEEPVHAQERVIPISKVRTKEIYLGSRPSRLLSIKQLFQNINVDLCELVPLSGMSSYQSFSPSFEQYDENDSILNSKIGN